MNKSVKFQLLSFVKGILAGLAIGLGGFLYILMSHYVPGELGKVLGSLLFAVDLFLVCTFGLSLYTGKIGKVFEEKQEKDFYISLPVMLVGNLIGAASLGLLLNLALKNTDIMNTVNGVCASRLTLNTFNDYLSLFVKSFLCGTCVYLAVYCFGKDRLKPLGIGLLVAFVFIFVYTGLQHCIANAFYLGFGNALANPYTYVNLLFCIMFNSFGPILGILLVKIAKK